MQNDLHQINQNLNIRYFHLLRPSLNSLKLMKLVRDCTIPEKHTYPEDVISFIFEDKNTDAARISIAPRMPHLWIISSYEFAMQVLRSDNVEKYSFIGGLLSVTGHRGIATSSHAEWQEQRTELSAFYRKSYIDSFVPKIRELVSREMRVLHDGQLLRQVGENEFEFRPDDYFKSISFCTSSAHVGVYLNRDMMSVFDDLVHEGLKEIASIQGLHKLMSNGHLHIPRNKRTIGLIEQWSAGLYPEIRKHLQTETKGMSETLVSKIAKRNVRSSLDEAGFQKASEEVFQILYASYETLAGTLSSAAHSLARDLQFQSLLRNLPLSHIGEVGLSTSEYDTFFFSLLQRLPSIPFLPPRIVNKPLKIYMESEEQIADVGDGVNH